MASQPSFPRSLSARRNSCSLELKVTGYIICLVRKTGSGNCMHIIRSASLPGPSPSFQPAIGCVARSAHPYSYQGMSQAVRHLLKPLTMNSLQFSSTNLVPTALMNPVWSGELVAESGDGDCWALTVSNRRDTVRMATPFAAAAIAAAKQKCLLAGSKLLRGFWSVRSQEGCCCSGAPCGLAKSGQKLHACKKTLPPATMCSYYASFSVAVQSVHSPMATFVKYVEASCRGGRFLEGQLALFKCICCTNAAH